MNHTRLIAVLLAGVSPVAVAAQDDGFLGTIVLASPPAPYTPPAPTPAPAPTPVAAPAPTLETAAIPVTPAPAPGVPGLIEDVFGVTSEGIALSNPADLSELFVAEPTIAVGSSIPMSQKLYVNGIEENNLAISIDGARQNNKIFHHNTTTLIDPALLKAVRIDPGVAPADAGPGALGGALAYETKDVADLLEPGDNFGGTYKLEFDTNGSILANSLALYGMQGGFEYLGFVKYASGNPREDGDDVTIVGSGTDVLSGLFKLAYQAKGGARFEFSSEVVSDDEARPYRANIGTIIGGRPVPPTRPYDLERQNFVLSYTEAEAKGWYDPKIQLAFSGTDLLLPEADQSSHGSTVGLSAIVQNRFAFGWGSVTAGVDFYHDVAQTEYIYVPDPAFNEAAEETLSNIGVFAQVRMRPTDEIRLSFGARADFQEFEGVDGTRQSASGLSGNLSGEWDATDRLTLSAGYSHVWGGVELAENFIMNPVWAYPAGGIEEVTADSAYLAFAYDMGAWVVDGKVFSTQIDNARAASYGGGPGLTTDLESTGVELGARYAWQNGFVRLGFASIDTELNGRTADSYTGNYLTMPMGEFVTVQAAHRFDNGLLIGGDAQWALEYEDTYDFGTGGRGPALPSYTVVNAFVEYAPPEVSGLTLRAEVNNLFDQTYASRATYGQEFVGEVIPLNEPGRSLRLSAEFRF